MELERAQRVVEAVVAAAASRGLRMAVAVVDAGGLPVVQLRMDGAIPAATDTVVAKARTAVAFDRPTTEVVADAKRFPTVYDSFLTATSRPLVYSMGGIPLRRAGRLEGAVAASGGSGEEDVAVAEAGLAAWEEMH